ncbi:hypothetical protein [Clostridium perfringens]|uniref:hypothetical protein n=1 Tax=Clostridium perfringens TaxID=1502 RepID=UPI0005B37102|nr:hypothetical protein [Clostridium perfringens]
MENNKKYLVKYNSQNYFCTCFDEIAEIMIGEENSETPITNRFLLIGVASMAVNLRRHKISIKI